MCKSFGLIFDIKLPVQKPVSDIIKEPEPIINHASHKTV